jgi:hypothetical protein
MPVFVATILTTIPVLGGEVTLGPIAPAAAVKGQNQFAPDVAHGKDGYLVVWQRSREETGRIECARLDAAGKPIDSPRSLRALSSAEGPLDEKPLVLAPDARWQEAPRVSFGNGMYLVVWQDLRNGKEFDIFASRVTPEGKVLDPGGVPVSRTPDASSRFPCAAFDPSTGSGQAGGSFIVVWSELAAGNEGNYQLFSARVSTDGKVAAPQPLEIKYQTVPLRHPPKQTDLVESDAVVCGDRLFVASGGWPFAQVFNLPDLKPVGLPEGWHPQSKDGTSVNKRRITRRPTAATDGKGFLFAVWCGSVDRSLALVNRVSTDGKVSEVYPENQAFWWNGRWGLMGPALAFDGENYLFVRHRWSNEKKDVYGVNSHICARRVTPDGKPVEAADLDVAGTTPAQLNTMPRLASDGKGHVLMVWEQRPTTPDGNIVAATRMITTK